MGKVLALLFIILLALASVAGYLFLTQKIAAGERQIADGQRQLEKGQSALAGGKAKLEAGKRELSEGKREYEQAKDNPLLVLADKLLKGGKGFEEGRRAGTARREGTVEAGQGARVACAVGGPFFASLSIVLGFCWRRSLARIFVRTEA